MRNVDGQRNDHAETVAIRALGWLAANDDLIGVFLGASGLALADLPQRATESDFLVSVLDFILMDDAWVVAFCDAEGIGYDIPRQARAALPGGSDVHWT